MAATWPMILRTRFSSFFFSSMVCAAKEAQKAGKDAQGKIGPLLQRAEAILSTTSKILDENRPRIADISAEIRRVICPRM